MAQVELNSFLMVSPQIHFTPFLESPSVGNQFSRSICVPTRLGAAVQVV